MNIELCNMCMITNHAGRVLVQERLPKATNAWCGLTFPGGHVEPGEAIIESVIREVREETGLTIFDVALAGFIQWYNPDSLSTYLVFLFQTTKFTGKLHGSAEGTVSWMTLSEMIAGNLAPNMEKYLTVFQNNAITQAFGISGKELELICQNKTLSL